MSSDQRAEDVGASSVSVSSSVTVAPLSASAVSVAPLPTAATVAAPATSVSVPGDTSCKDAERLSVKLPPSRPLASSSSLPTLHVVTVEQITSIIQRLKKDQEIELRNQREQIVQQVLQTLFQLPNASDAAARSDADGVATSPIGLDAKLHQLMHHSLSESGLNYPHVITNSFVAPTNANGNGSSSSFSTGSPGLVPVANQRFSHRTPRTGAKREPNESKTVRFATAKELVLMRQEIPEVPRHQRQVEETKPLVAIAAHGMRSTDRDTERRSVVGESASQAELGVVHDTKKVSPARSTKKHTEPLDWVDSPFACPVVTTKQHKAKSKPDGGTMMRRRRVKVSNAHNEEQEAAEEDQELDHLEALEMNMDKLKNSIDRRTLAILERSKKLLLETKYPKKKKYYLDDQMALKHTMPRPVVTSSTSQEALQDHIEESRETEADTTPVIVPTQASVKNSNVLSPTGQQAESTEVAAVAIDPPVSAVQQEQPSSDSPTLKAVTHDTLLDQSSDIPKPTDKQLIEQVHEQVNSIELLQPLKREPLNDNEWENELARQILTIYATSVRAKALQNGGATQGGELQSTNAPNEKQPNSTSKKAGVGAGAGAGAGVGARLPSIHPKSPGCPRRTTYAMVNALRSHGVSAISPTNRSVNFSWEPSHQLENGKVVINLPKVTNPIWFAGTGAVKAVWCAIAMSFLSLKSNDEGSHKPKYNVDSSSICSHRICEELRTMEANKKYAKYIATVESLIVSLVRSIGIDELVVKLWKQLVVTCNAFASRCIDYKKFPIALGLMKQTEELIQNSVLVSTDELRLELMAFVYDTYGYYYYKRHKPHAGLQYVLKAQDIHARQENWSHIAKCRLHLANMQNQLGQHREALESLVSILQMIDENKLEEQQDLPEDAQYAFSTSSAQKICLAAICYNNLAIEQLHHKDFEAAHTSSTNAKRLAKLCLSYSNRWLSQFETTSKCVSLAIATLMEKVSHDQAM